MSTAESGRESYRPQRTELVWEGKRTQVERIALPFQVVETINVSRATREETPLLAGLQTNPASETSPDGAGDQCPQAARIVNQDVLARRGLWSMPPVPWEGRVVLQMSVRKYLPRFGSC